MKDYALLDAETWQMVRRRFPVGSVTSGRVIRVEPFGVFIDIVDCRSHAVLLVTEFEDGDRAFDLPDYPQVGDLVTAVIVDHVDHNRQLHLSTRASRLKGN